jgi:hypothetical protein
VSAAVLLRAVELTGYEPKPYSARIVRRQLVKLQEP